MQKEHILYKPIFIGFCVLDIAKYVMYDFHYDFIKRKYDIDITRHVFK